MGKEESLLKLIAGNLCDLIYAIDKSGRLVFLQGACSNISGFEPEELIGKQFLDLINPLDRATTEAYFDQAAAGKTVPFFESYLLNKAGSQVLLQWSFSWLAAEELVVGLGRNVTHTAHKTQDQLRQEALYKVLLNHGTDMAALLDTEGRYLYFGDSAAALMKGLGYKPKQLLGRCFLDFIHPDDLEELESVMPKVMETNGPVLIPEFRFRTAGGEYRWIETTAINQFLTPNINGMIVTSMDVTERVLSRQKLQESEKRYKALFQNNPNMILLENTVGILQDVNPAVLINYGYSKEQVLGQHFGAFINPDNLDLCLDMFEKAMTGEQVKFEVEEFVGRQGWRTLEIMKVPVVMENKVTAIFSICQDITDVKNSYQTIQRQAQKLNTILESITDAFFTLDHDWNLTYINSEFDRIMKTDRSKMIGRKIFDFFPEVDFPNFYQHYREAFETGKTVRFECYSHLLNLWLEVKAFPSEEGLSVYFSDVTEKVKSQQELQKLSLVASRTINGVMFLNPALQIEWVNEAFTNMTGYSLDEVIGQMPEKLLQGPGTDKETSQRLIDKIAATLAFSEEILNYRKNGEQFWVALDFTPVLDQTGQLARYIVLQTDITYRKETEAAQQKLTRDLYRQNLDMQQFTYIVSHNLRSPVANALGYAQLLAVTSPQAETYPQFLENLQISIQRLDDLLKDLNQLLSIRDNKDNIGLEKVDLAAKCRTALASLEDSLQQTDAEVEVQIPPDTFVTGNKVYLQSIFYNLISNAIKYRAPGRKLKISIKHQPDSDGNSLVTVSDNGSGFDREKVGDQIFKLYKRFHNNLEGRGVGLFLVKTQIEAMGGQIEVTSTENVGTTFYLNLK